MNKKSLSLLTAGVIAMLSACGDNVVEADANSPIETEAKLTVIVQDAVTGEPLDGVAVTLMSAGEKKNTAGGGKTDFEGVRSGSHRLLLNKTGYASTIGTAAINDNSATGDIGVYIAQDNAVILSLSPLNAGLVGHIYRQDSTGKEIPAAGIDMRLQLTTTTFVDRIFTATTDAAGQYKFENLPANAAYTLTTLETTIGGIIYTNASLGTTPATLNPDVTNYVTAKTTLNISAGTQSIFAVTSYNNVIAADKRTDAVKLVFSEEIDAAQFKSSMISSVNYTNTPTAAVYTVTVSKDTLIFTPADKWREDFTITINSTAANGLRSVKGKVIALPSNPTNFPVIVRLENLSNVAMELKIADTTFTNACATTHNIKSAGCTIDNAGNSIYLTWNKVEGATSYQIYAKVEGENQDAYVAVGTAIQNTVNAISKDSIVASVALPYSLSSIQDRTIKYLIRAINAMSQSKLDETKALTVVDNKNPTSNLTGYASTDSVLYFCSLSPANFATGYLNSYMGLGDAKVDVCTQTITFSEPMDTTGVTYTPKQGRLSLAHSWTNETTLVLTLNVDAGIALDNTTNITGEGVKFTIGGLKDKNQGNPYEFLYNLTAPANHEKKVNTMDFRFVTSIP